MFPIQGIYLRRVIFGIWSLDIINCTNYVLHAEFADVSYLPILMSVHSEGLMHIYTLLNPAADVFAN